MRWLRRLRHDPAERKVPVAEAMEPRLLFSADIAAGLGLAATAQIPAQVRTLTATGEYAGITATATRVDAASLQATYQATYSASGLAFEANQGQGRAGVDFVAAGSGYGIELAGGNATLTLGGSSGTQSVGLTLAGAHAGVTAQGENLLAARTNYALGSDPSQWVSDIANYGAVRYAGVYDGVDVRYYGTQRQLEYDFVVAPGADAAQVHLQFTGTDGASVADNGDLVLQVAGGSSEVRFKAPVSYQRNADGTLQAVASRYQVNADGTTGFALGDYDHARDLVIDPVLDYATYFGGSGTDSALAVATDAGGNVYVTGSTTSSTGAFAAVDGSGGGSDIFVAKFSPDLSTLLWSTRIGGSGNDQGNAIAVDANGNVAVGGWSQSNNFPGAGGGLLGLGGGQEAVVLKLDASGTVVFSKGFDGNGGTDSTNAVGFDAAGNVHAAGQISNTGLLSGVLGTLLGSSDNAFVSKYSATGSLVYQQEFGGGSTDAASGLAVGAGGDVYVVGTTQSSNMPMTGGAQTSLSGSSDGFLVHMDASGNAVYSTFVGGTDNDTADAVDIDGSGNAFVVGTTKARSSVVFTTTSNAFMTSSNANNKMTGYLREYDTTQAGAASLVYSSYLGGTQTDSPTGVAYARGRVVVTGQAGSSDFPVTADAYEGTNAGNALFLVTIDPVGGGSSDLQYGTFYGNNMSGGGLAMAGDHAVITAGVNSSGLATTGAYQATKGGGSDGLVVSFTAVPNTAPVLSGAVQPPAILEDSAPGSGFLVSSLIAGQVSDADPGALQGIAITATDTTNGNWQYTVNGGTTWTDIGTVSSTSALLLAADGQTSIRFVPAADYAGTVTSGLAFRAWDETGGSVAARVDTSSNGGMTAFSSATASIDMGVTAVNDPPVRTAGSVANLVVAEDSPATNLGLNGLQYGPGGGADETSQVLTYTVTAVPAAAFGTIQLANGTAVSAGSTYTINDLRSMKFQPAANANGGPVTFSWSVTDNGGGTDTLDESLTITVTPVNDPPVANPDSFTGTEDTPLTLTAAQLLGNDTDVEGDPLTIASVNAASGGSVVLNADGSVTFTPTANFNGLATFKYKAGDGQATSGFATVSINLAPVNDAPVANPDTLAATEDTPVTYTAAQLLGNDTDPDGDVLTIGSITSGAGGNAVLNADGSVTFTPDANFNGPAGFSYTASDGVLSSAATGVTVNVAAVNDAPTNSPVTLPPVPEDSGPVTITSGQLLANASDVDVGDTLAVVGLTASRGTLVDNGNGTWTYTSVLNDDTGVTFWYGVSDGTVTVAGSASMDLTPVNDAPVANPDTLSATEDTPVTYNAADLLGNDTDVEGDALTIAGVSNVSGGKAVLNANGTVTFTPDADFNGLAQFHYTVSDGQATSAPAMVNVQVAPVDDAPVLQGGSTVAVSVPEHTVDVATVVASDADGDPLAFSIAAGSDAGRFAIDPATGKLTFATAPDYNAPTDANHDNVYNVVVQVSDGMLTSTQTYSVTVQDVPVTQPVAPPAASPGDVAPPVPMAPPAAPGPTGQPALPGATGSGATPAAPSPAPAPAPSPGRIVPGAGPGPGELVNVVTSPAPDAAPSPRLGSSGTALPGEAETARLDLRIAISDRSGIELIALQAQDFGADTRFGIAPGAGTLATEQLQRSLRSSDFTGSLDRLRRDVRDNLQLEQSMTISVAGVSLGLSLVYVLWLIRGGVLMGSYLSALPAWRFLDPLPVLARTGDDEADDDDDGLEARGDEGRNVLRGFG